MSSDKSYFQIVIDEKSKGALLAALNEAAAEAGANSNRFEVVEGDAAIAKSELQLEPITTTVALLYVANVIVSGTAGYFIGKALDRVFKASPQHIVVVISNGEQLRYDPDNPDEAAKLLEHFQKAGS